MGKRFFRPIEHGVRRGAAVVDDSPFNFTWTRETPDRWTATLRSIDRQGRPQTTVYPMERVRR